MALFHLKNFKLNFSFIGRAQCSNKIKNKDYKKYYQLLEIPEHSNPEEIKMAYIKMAKKYHPDNNSPESSADKFHEVEEAFRIIMDKKFQENLVDEVVDGHEEEEEESNNLHTPLRHRQYLSYEGIGFGNIFQREKQYNHYRTMQASQNVMNHRLMKEAQKDETSLTVTQPVKHNIKSQGGVDNLVESLIKESMSKGQFDNLSGFGKPLQDHRSKNPYVDFVTYKVNQIMIDNGFVPEWISLQKEIREDVEVFRNKLCLERVNFPPFPLTIEQNINWTNAVYKHKQLVDEVNLKINRYNLIVPVLQRQMLFLNLRNEAQNILINGRSTKDIINNFITQKQHDGNKDGAFLTGFFKIIESFFKK